MNLSFARTTMLLFGLVLCGEFLCPLHQVKAQANDQKIPILQTVEVDEEWVWYYVSWNQLNAAGAWFPGEGGKQPDMNELAGKALAACRAKHGAEAALKVTEIAFHNTSSTMSGHAFDLERQAKKGHWFCAIRIEISQKNLKESIGELYVLLLDGTMAEAKRNTPTMQAEKLKRQKWLRGDKP